MNNLYLEAAAMAIDNGDPIVDDIVCRYGYLQTNDLIRTIAYELETLEKSGRSLSDDDQK